jgi:hypothetical protein
MSTFATACETPLSAPPWWARREEGELLYRQGADINAERVRLTALI